MLGREKDLDRYGREIDVITLVVLDACVTILYYTQFDSTSSF